MAEETELASKKTALVGGGTSTRMGTLVVTSERIVFTDTLMNKDRMRVTTATEEYLFNDGWKSLSMVLREAFGAAGRQVVEQGPDHWTVQ